MNEEELFAKRLAEEKAFERRLQMEHQSSTGQSSPEMNPTKDFSFGKSAMINAGEQIYKFGAGTADLFDTMMLKFAEGPSKKKIEDRMAERKAFNEMADKRMETLSDAHPGAAMVGDIAPYITGPIAASIGKAPVAVEAATHLARPTTLSEMASLAKMLGKETAIGGGIGAAHYDMNAKEGALLGLGGGIVGRTVGKTLGGNAKRLSPEDDRIITWAKKKHLFIPPGMATGDPKIQQMDQALATHPSTAAKFVDHLRQGKYAENRLISEELTDGLDLPTADIFSNEYLTTVETALKNKMDQLAENTTGLFSPGSTTKVNKIIKTFQDLDPEQKSKPILDKYKEMIQTMSATKKPFTGEQYQKWTQDLRNAANNQYNSTNGDNSLGKALRSIANLFDDAISNSKGADKETWKKTLKQYAMLNAIQETKNISRIRGISESGHIDAQVLAKKFKSNDTINKLADVERIRKHQQGASLSTSSHLGRALISGNPNEALGAGMLLSSRIPSGFLGLSDIAASLYLKGYPHATGLAPIFGRTRTEPLISSMVPKVAQPLINDGSQ